MISTLQEQIEVAARTIATDSYAMSIGELINMYRDEEIDIHPEFQRAYRWGIDQKSKLIESILLGIPMPPIFIFHRRDGIWDVIDGQQRLSTIFEFAGIYVDENKKLSPKIKLEKTKFLPALENIVWEDENDDVYQLTQAQRLLIKRAKIDVKLLKSTSDKDAKYDLFQRLNTGGSHLTPQEIRTCLIIMENKEFYDILSKMRENADFKTCLPLTDRAIKEQEDLEYIIRFIVARHGDINNMPSSLHEYFDNTIINLISTEALDVEKEVDVFEKTFKYINNMLGENAFKRYDIEHNKFVGSITLSAYEAMVPEVSKKIDYYISEVSKNDFMEKVKRMHTNKQYGPFSGRRSTNRFTALLKVGQEVF